MAWQGIEGHDAIAERFVAAHARGRISGSYLFVGPPGVGKGTFALALAKSLTCERPQPGLVACGGCASCVQADAGSHPDIDVVRKPDDRSTIPLELLIGDDEHRMRQGLCWRILLKPALGSRKVAVIMDADHFSEEAANCLLTTLEAPPDGAAIILVGTALEQFLAAFLLEPRIADGDDLVDQVAVELDRQGQAESQPRAHARRVSFDGREKVFTEFCEPFDIVQDVFEWPAIDSGDE
jgi:DNA polymerase-3 subunit delta'